MNNIYKIASYYRKLKQKCPILYQFLKENKALKAFAKNCGYEYYPESIVNAFIWHKTKEGRVFWFELNSKFIYYKDELLKEL